MIGKTVAARIEKLFDRDTFTPFNPDENNGFVTGQGKIDGCDVMVSFMEPDELPQSPFKGLQDHLALLAKAQEKRLPVLLVMDTPAMHKSVDKSPFPQDPIRLLADSNGMGRWYAAQARLSGKAPQLAVVFTRLGAAITFPVALCDGAVMLESAGMSIGRPDVVEKMTGQPVDYAQLGGAAMHYAASGSIDHVSPGETDAFVWVRRYLACMKKGDQTTFLPPELDRATLEKSIPKSPLMAFDTYQVLKGVIDAGTLFELRGGIAKELITGFARIEGRIAGIVANNSAVRGGVFFPETCRKAARFVSICDAYGIPMLFLADNAGFMIGPQVEQAGTVREGSLLFATIANAAVPKLSVVMRRSYTAGVYAMAGPGSDPERFIALPGAVISIYGKGVADKLSTRGVDEEENSSIQEMMSGAEDPHRLVEMGLLDEVVEVGSLRSSIAAFLENVSDRAAASGKPILLV